MYIINKFGGEDLKQKMESYKLDLQSFRKATRLCDFISCWPVKGQTPPETELREFVAKVGHHWDDCTLEDLETLKGVITRKFFLPDFTLQLKKITEGSIIITWLIPTPFVMALQEAIETTSSEFFVEQEIETITIDGQQCYPFPTRKPVPCQSEKLPVGVLPKKLKSDISKELIFLKLVKSGRFEMAMRVLTQHPQLAYIPLDIAMHTKLAYFHFLFKVKDITMTTRTLCSDEMNVRSHYSWTPLDYYVTGHAISHSKCSWRLTFECSSIDDEKLEQFIQGCATPRGTGWRGCISHADFMGSGLTSKSIQLFVNIPPHILQGMRVLKLDGNKLDGSACDLLAQAVPSMPRLEHLWLSCNLIGSGGAVKVIKALCSSRIELLLLYDTGIGVPDCHALCELLTSSSSIQRLDIDGNNLSSESVASIITGLSHNSSLTTLDISKSHFSMTNVASLSSVLKDCSKCTLTKLKLQGCQISSEGAVELATALSTNTILEHLYLGRNPIGVEGVHQLINNIKENQTIRQLWLPKKYKSATSDLRITWQ